MSQSSRRSRLSANAGGPIASEVGLTDGRTEGDSELLGDSGVVVLLVVVVVVV